MKKLTAILLSLVLLVCMTACTANSNANRIKKDMKIGFIIGDMSEKCAKKRTAEIESFIQALQLKDKQVMQTTDVTEQNCYNEAVVLAENKCDLIFCVANRQLEDYIVQAATEYPDIEFCFAGGSQAETSNIGNYHNFSIAKSQSRYVSGVVAGMKLNDLINNGEITESQLKIGYIATAKDSDNVSDYTALFLGAKSVCPEVTLGVQYTQTDNGDKKDEMAAKALIANGYVLVAQHSGTSNVAEICQQNNVYYIGDSFSATDKAPQFALTSTLDDMSVCYTYAVNHIAEHKTLPAQWSNGYESKACNITQINESAFASTDMYKQTQEKVSKVEKQLKNNTLHEFDISTWTVNGQTITSTATDNLAEEYFGVEYINNGYFMEYELTSSPKFNFLIDGISQLN